VPVQDPCAAHRARRASAGGSDEFRWTRPPTDRDRVRRRESWTGGPGAV